MFASRFRRLRVLTVLAAVGLASVGAVTTAHARSISAKPTIVLVHGAFADSSGFDGVIDRLRHDGYPLRAAPNPLVGLQYDAASVRGFLDSIKGPKILVGHSYGGAVITQAASGDPDVKALVYLAAFAPERGEVLGKLLNRPVAHPAAPLPLISVDATQPDGTKCTDFYLDPSKFRARFAADLPQRVAADLAATQPPTSAATFTAKLTVEPAWKTIPSWYLVAKQDKAASPISSGSWRTASTRTRARSTARTPSTSATPRRSPSSSSKPRERPAEQRHRLLAPLTRAAGAGSSLSAA
jgi:pimeloyl-ACP methyl ester carboxylesterase